MATKKRSWIFLQKPYTLWNHFFRQYFVFTKKILLNIFFFSSLHLTTMCLRFSPTIVACVCIHLACKWSNYKIPLSAQNKEWFTYIDNEATQDLLDRLTEEFLAIFEKCPSRLKKKIMSQAQDVSSAAIFKLLLYNTTYYCNIRPSLVFILVAAAAAVVLLEAELLVNKQLTLFT